MVHETSEDNPPKGPSKPSNFSTGSFSRFVGSMENTYETLIEKGKHKLGYYRPEVTEDDRFLMSFLIYFTILLMVVFVADYLAQTVYEDSNSLGPLQHAEVEIVYSVQKDVFGMPVTVNRTDNTIWYNVDAEWNGQNFTKDEKIGGFGLQIDSVCTGFHEMVFLGVLIVGFRGPPLKLRLKWAGILLGVVFIENLIRIIVLYPLALYKGREFEDWFHFYWWHYGQYVFIMTLFGLWFIFVAQKHMNQSKDAVSKEGKERGSEKERKSENSDTETDTDEADGDEKEEAGSEGKSEAGTPAETRESDTVTPGEEDVSEGVDENKKTGETPLFLPDDPERTLQNDP